MKKTEEELLEELQQLYDSGQIDNVFFDRETKILKNKILNRKRREKEVQKEIKFNKISKFAVPLILIVSFAILIFNINDGNTFYFKKYEYYSYYEVKCFYSCYWIFFYFDISWGQWREHVRFF